MAEKSGPRPRGKWCCSCGVHYHEEIALARCPVSHARMQAMRTPSEGLSHLWAYGGHERAMRIWNDDANVRARLSVGAKVEEER